MMMMMIGGDSGKVHSTVKQRWLDNDLALVSGMTAIASYADQAVESLRVGDFKTLALLATKNFAMRRQLYGRLSCVHGMDNAVHMYV